MSVSDFIAGYYMYDLSEVPTFEQMVSVGATVNDSFCRVMINKTTCWHGAAKGVCACTQSKVLSWRMINICRALNNNGVLMYHFNRIATRNESDAENIREFFRCTATYIEPVFHILFPLCIINNNPPSLNLAATEDHFYEDKSMVTPPSEADTAACKRLCELIAKADTEEGVMRYLECYKKISNN
jgi:hypothetical protein